MITSNGLSRSAYITKIIPIEKEIDREMVLLRGIKQAEADVRSRLELLRRDLGKLNHHLAIIRAREEEADNDHT